MATYTDGVGYNLGTTARIPDKSPSVKTVSVELNFADITTDRAAASLTALANGDILPVIRVPAKSYVLAVGLDVTTAEGGTCTVDIGDGSDGDGYLDGVNANTAASYASALALTEAAPNTVTGYSNGKYYSAEDTIDLTMVNAMDTAVVRVWAVIADCA
jgi:hypothetical protein